MNRRDFIRAVTGAGAGLATRSFFDIGAAWRRHDELWISDSHRGGFLISPEIQDMLTREVNKRLGEDFDRAYSGLMLTGNIYRRDGRVLKPFTPEWHAAARTMQT